MAKLLDQVREAIRVRHYSIRTEDAYVGWITQFIRFHGTRHPIELGEGEINAFLTFLAVERKVAASTQNQAMAALLFLYQEVLDRPLGEFGEVVRARRPDRLPVVMTRAEVKAVLDLLTGEKWLIASLLYGAGLRLLEGLRLRVKDVDFGQNLLVVRDGKGQKDRVTLLPKALADPLRRQIEHAAAVHEQDVREGFGRVYLPDALASKYPNAERRTPSRLAVRLPGLEAEEGKGRKRGWKEKGTFYFLADIVEKVECPLFRLLSPFPPVTPAGRVLRTDSIMNARLVLPAGLSVSCAWPSDHSVSNHPVGPVIALTHYPSASRASGRLRSGLRRSLAGSPHDKAESSSLALRTGRSPPVAPHPASRRRSYVQLQTGECMPEEDFHLSDQAHLQTH